MKAVFIAVLVLFALTVLTSASFAKGPAGKALFDKHCASCHANGGNDDNPAYTLHKKDLQRHGVRTVNDIVKRMRHPGPGMPTFSKKAIPDAQAKEIARFILKTYNK